MPNGVSFWDVAVDSPNWDDVAMPVSIINPTGLPSPPSVDNTDGTFLFGSGVDNIVAFLFQLPHSWREGTDFHFHIHWSKTTNAGGTVNWEMQFATGNTGRVMPAFSGFTAGSAQVADADTANLMAIREWIIPGAGLTASCICKAVLRRRSAAGGDTYGADAKLYSADLHIQKNTFGSEIEWAKGF